LTAASEYQAGSIRQAVMGDPYDQARRNLERDKVQLKTKQEALGQIPKGSSVPDNSHEKTPKNSVDLTRVDRKSNASASTSGEQKGGKGTGT